MWQLTGWQLSSELRDVWTMSDNYSYLSKSVTSVQSRVLCKIPCFFVLLSVIWNVSNVSVSLSMLLSSLTTVSWWHLPWLRATLHDDTMCSMFPLLCTTLIVVCFVFNISTVKYGLGQYSTLCRIHLHETSCYRQNKRKDNINTDTAQHSYIFMCDVQCYITLMCIIYISLTNDVGSIFRVVYKLLEF